MATMTGIIVEFKAKTDEITRAFDTISTRATNIVNTIGKVGAAFTAVAAGGALVAWNTINNKIQETADKIDELSKMAGVIGIPVAELQRLSYVADLAGVSVGELNNTFSFMSRSIGRASLEGGKAAEVYKKLGLNLNELKQLNPAEQFNLISKAIAGINSKSEQAAIASEIFSRGYQTTLKLIRQGVTETSKEFDKFGTTLTDQQAQAVEDFNDSTTRIAAIWEGMWTKITAYVSPYFTMLNKAIGDAIIEFGGLDKIAEIVGSTIVSAVELAIGALNRLLDALSGVQKALLFIEDFNLNRRRDSILQEQQNELGGSGIRPEQFRNRQDFVNVATMTGESYLPAIGTQFKLQALDRELDKNQKAFNDLERASKIREDTEKKIIDSIKKTDDSLVSIIPSFSDLKKSVDAASKNIVDSSNKAMSSILDMVNSKGQSKLQQLIGNTSGKDGIKQVDDEQLDRLITSIYNKAVSGGGGASYRGYVNGKETTITDTTALQDFKSFERSLENRLTGSNAGAFDQYIGVRNELKKYLDTMDNKQKVDVNIKVETEEGFLLKVAQSQEVYKAASQAAVDQAAKAAKMGAK